MQAIVLGVVINESDAVVLKKLIDVSKLSKNDLTKSKLCNSEEPLIKLVNCGYISKKMVGKYAHYTINNKGIEAYNNLPTELIEAAGKKKSSTSKSTKSDEIAALNGRIDSIEKKIDQILNILINSQVNQGDGKNVVSNNGDKLDSFKKSLVEEYKKLVSREFLSDGKVWHDQLKHIMMDRYDYKDYEYDELLQRLKVTNIGMVSISQGKDKTWIEIRA